MSWHVCYGRQVYVLLCNASVELSAPPAHTASVQSVISYFPTPPKKFNLRTKHVVVHSGGTIASALGVLEKVWEGGRSIMKKINDPLLLASSSNAFEKASDPGGLGYDSLSKCEGKTQRNYPVVWVFLQTTCSCHILRKQTLPQRQSRRDLTSCTLS